MQYGGRDSRGNVLSVEIVCNSWNNFPMEMNKEQLRGGEQKERKSTTKFTEVMTRNLGGCFNIIFGFGIIGI